MQPTFPIRSGIRFLVLVIATLCCWAVLSDIVYASGSGYGGGRRGGVGIGIMLGPGLSAPVDRGPDFDAVERNLKRQGDAMREGDGQERKSQPVAKQKLQAKSVQALRKLSPQRAPFLYELATDIDPALAKLALANFTQTVDFYRNVLAQAKKTQDSKGEMDALAQLGHIYFVTGWFSEATKMYEQSLDVAQKTSARKGEADARRNLAYTLIAYGNFSKASGYASESLQIYSDLGDAAGQQMVLNNLGVLEKNLGLFQKARANFASSIEADPANQKRLALVLSNMANLDRSWSVNAKALEYYGKAYEAALQSADTGTAVEALIAAGNGYIELGDYQSGLKSLNAALAKLRESGGRTDWVTKLIGDAYSDLGMYNEAESLLKEADYDSSLGRLYLLKSQPDLAGKHYEQLLQAAVAANNLDEIFTAHVGLGKVRELGGNYGEAGKHYAKALEITEQMRSSLLPSDRRNFYASKVNGFRRSEPVQGLTRLSLREKNSARSIDSSELKRAREFADTLSRKFDFDAFGVPREILDQETDLANQLASLKTALPVLPQEADPRRYTDLTNQIKRVESQANTLSQQIATKYKNYAAVRYPKPVSLAEALIEPNEYVVLFDLAGDAVGARLLKGKKVVKTAYIEEKAEDLEREVREFRKPFESVQLDKCDPQKAARLYDRLLRDLLHEVPEGTPLFIIPDGLLALLPFEALVTGGTPTWKQGRWGAYPTGVSYLGDEHPIVYYPSLTALTQTRSLVKKGGAGERVFVMADPVFTMTDARAQGAGEPVKMASEGRQGSLQLMAAIEDETGGFYKLPRLPQTESLANSLEQLYGAKSDVYTGLASSKSNFLTKVIPNLNTYESVVFATHGFAANSIPGIMEPVLALSMVPPGTDGFLTMSEVAGLRMSPGVAALVACQTGVGMKLAGEGVMSMGRAFLSAGAKSVTMSLWSVSEQSSVQLMETFFKNLKNGTGRLEAWTDARKSLRQAGFEHPFFWSAFILVGEPQVKSPSR